MTLSGDHGLWLKSPGLLLEHLGIDEPGEIVLESIAQACGATIVYEPLEGSEARLLGVGNRAVITVKDKASRARQRFSAAHELGHWLHDRGKIALTACAEGKLLEEWGQRNLERRANRFATGLLLPRTMFKPLARHKPISFATARDLSAYFETSLTATTIRLVELGSFPAMLVCYHGRRKRWSMRNSFVPETLEARAALPQVISSLHPAPARDDGEGVALLEEPQAYPSELWIDHRDAVFYTVYVEICVTGKNTLLALITWKDEAQLIDAATPLPT